MTEPLKPTQADREAARKFISEWPRHGFADFIEPALAEAFMRHRLAAERSTPALVEKVARAICWAMTEESDDCSSKCLNAKRCLADPINQCFVRDARAALSVIPQPAEKDKP